MKNYKLLGGFMGFNPGMVGCYDPQSQSFTIMGMTMPMSNYNIGANVLNGNLVETTDAVTPKRIDVVVPPAPLTEEDLRDYVRPEDVWAFGFIDKKEETR